MGFGDVVNEFLDQNGLSNTGTSEETNFATTGVGSEEVDNLDTSLQHLSGSGLINEGRGVGMDRGQLDTNNRTTLVNRFANDVHDTTECSLSNGNEDRRACVDNPGSTNETLCTVHGNGTDRVLTQMRCDLQDETTAAEVLNLEGIQDGGEVVSVELDVNNGTNDSFYRPNGTLCFSCIGASWMKQHFFRRDGTSISEKKVG